MILNSLEWDTSRK